MTSSSESLIDFENEKDLSNLSTPSSTKKSLLPASMSNLTVIDATPSHEVQMRVKRDETLPGGSKQTNEHSYFSYNNKVTSNDADDENATSKLFNELKHVGDTEHRIWLSLRVILILKKVDREGEIPCMRVLDSNFRDLEGCTRMIISGFKMSSAGGRALTLPGICTLTKECAGFPPQVVVDTGV